MGFFQDLVSVFDFIKITEGLLNIKNDLENELDVRVTYEKEN